MIPIDFEQSNKILGRPPTMTVEECSSLHIYNHGGVCISCWELSEEELQEVIKTKKIYISVWSGTRQPPIALMAKSPFIQEG